MRDRFPSDSPEERLRKGALVLVTLLIVPLSAVWVATYSILGLWVSAAIPFAYQGMTTFFLSGRAGG